MKEQVRYKNIPKTLIHAVIAVFNQGGDNRDSVIAGKLGTTTTTVHKILDYEIKACKSRMRETRLNNNKKKMNN